MSERGGLAGDPGLGVRFLSPVPLSCAQAVESLVASLPGFCPPDWEPAAEPLVFSAVHDSPGDRWCLRDSGPGPTYPLSRSSLGRLYEAWWGEVCEAQGREPRLYGVDIDVREVNSYRQVWVCCSPAVRPSLLDGVLS